MTLDRVKRRATRDAMAALQDHWTDGYGEVPLPVDATQIAERMGAEVFLAPLRTDLSGFIYKAPGRPAEITINSGKHIHHRRFTCAHELGHLIDNLDRSEIGYVDNRDTLSSAGTDPKEVYANTFAAALLMPEDEVEYYAPTHDLYGLARLFNVSTEAMTYRLETLRLRCVGQ